MRNRADLRYDSYPPRKTPIPTASSQRKSSREERVKEFAGDTPLLNGSSFRDTYTGSFDLPSPALFGVLRQKADVTHFSIILYRRLFRWKKVVTVHDMVYKAFPETVRGRTKFMEYGSEKSMKRARHNRNGFGVSKSEILKYFPQHSGKIRVVPCGVDTEKLRPCDDMERISQVKTSLGIEGDYFSRGTIEPRNLGRLIFAYNALAKKLPDAPKLVLAGGKGWLCDDITQRSLSFTLKTRSFSRNTSPLRT